MNDDLVNNYKVHIVKTHRPRKRVNIFLVILFLSLLGLLVGGIATSSFAETFASLTDLEMVGRFNELEKAAEQKLISQSRPSSGVLGPLCLAYGRVKRYDKLFDCLDRLEMQIESGDSVLMTDKALISNSDATPMPNMLRAEALIELGRYQEAIERAKIALGKIKDRLPFGMWPPKMYRLSIMGTLGLAYALGGDHQNATEQIKQLEDLSLGFMGSAFNRTFRANAIARIYMAFGEYEKAFGYVKNEDSLWKRAVWFANNMSWGYSGEDGRQIYLTLPKLLIRGKCLSEMGDLEEAKKTLDAILRNARIADNGELYWLTLFERGRVAERQKNFIEAIEFYKRAVGVIEQQRSTINTEANKIGFVGDKQVVYGRLINLLVEQNRIVESFEYVERSKSRALVDLLAAKQDFSVKDGDAQEIRDLLASNKKTEMEAVVQDASPETPKRRGVVINSVKQLQKESPELASLVSVTSITVSDIQAFIPPDEALLEYYYSGDNLYAFILTREGLKSIRLDGKEIEADIRQFRRLLQNPRSTEYSVLSRSLYQRLIEPLEKSLDRSKMVIVPHGILHYLPFNALENDKGSLIEHYSIRLLPSASVIKYLRARKTEKPGDILAFGNPDLGDPQYDLVYAGEEAKAVASIYLRSKVLLRKEATETAFEKYAEGFTYIHFATHGHFDPEAPLKSALLLAGDAESDGMLTVDRLYSMRMDTDLATLSACETGLGKIANGDDVVGLTRGFLYAGSSSIVASLWEVDDLATSELMKEFYNALKKGNKRDALRQAQLKIKKKYPHPFYWASFQLTGNSD